MLFLLRSVIRVNNITHTTRLYVYIYIYCLDTRNSFIVHHLHSANVDLETTFNYFFQFIKKAKKNSTYYYLLYNRSGPLAKKHRIHFMLFELFYECDPVRIFKNF